MHWLARQGVDEEASRNELADAVCAILSDRRYAALFGEGSLGEAPIAATLADGMAILERLCASVEAGAFVATNEKDDCRYCDYASICRDVHRVTSQSKELMDRDDLVPLRHFRELRRG